MHRFKIVAALVVTVSGCASDLSEEEALLHSLREGFGAGDTSADMSAVIDRAIVARDFDLVDTYDDLGSPWTETFWHCQRPKIIPSMIFSKCIQTV